MRKIIPLSSKVTSIRKSTLDEPRIELMCKTHPRFDEFIERLAGPTACNFTKTKWVCTGGSGLIPARNVRKHTLYALSKRA